MKMTLLEVVQSVLSSLDSTPVNTIGEPEGSQVALVAKEVFAELATTAEWAKDKLTTQLESVIDVNRPNYLKIPENIVDIQEFWYDVTDVTDTDKVVDELTYCKPNDFLSLVLKRNSSDAEITSVEDFNGWNMYIYNERKPQYWTSFDDVYVLTDAYNSDVETTLHREKTIVNATRAVNFLLADNYIPEMPAQEFPMYLARVKEKCWAYYKGTSNAVDRQEATRGLSRMRQKNQRTDQNAKPKNYGRRG